MLLNSSKLIAKWTAWYSGISLYLANTAAQSAAESGGTTPTTGFHSVIDRPESVSRVMPPTTTIRKINAQQTNSQAATTTSLSAAVALPTVGDAVAKMDTGSDPRKTDLGQVRMAHQNDNCGGIAAVFTAGAQLMQAISGVDDMEPRPYRRPRLANPHRVKLAFDIAAPELQKASQLREV